MRRQSKEAQEKPKRYTTYLKDSNRIRLKIFAAITGISIGNTFDWLIETFLPAPNSDESLLDFEKRVIAMLKKQKRKSRK